MGQAPIYLHREQVAAMDDMGSLCDAVPFKPLKSEQFSTLADKCEALRELIGDMWEGFPEEASNHIHDAFNAAIEGMHQSERNLTNLMHMCEWLEEEGNHMAHLSGYVARAKSAGVIR